jgi:hypothetical protein
VSQQNLQKGNFLGINSSSGISLEISELQTNFLWIKMAFRSLGHSSLTIWDTLSDSDKALILGNSTARSSSCKDTSWKASWLSFPCSEYP